METLEKLLQQIQDKNIKVKIFDKQGKELEIIDLSSLMTGEEIWIKIL